MFIIIEDLCYKRVELSSRKTFLLPAEFKRSIYVLAIAGRSVWIIGKAFVCYFGLESILNLIFK